jgi:glycosyltransferase involved in cell wall biosynthesis
LYEALAAGRPLITGDFGEIADVVREAECGIVLPEYSSAEIQKAFTILEDVSVRNAMAANAVRFGRTFLNWEKGEAVLYQEYSSLLPGALREPCFESGLQFEHVAGVQK